MNMLKNTPQKGFSLIEIMIALTIGLFLMAGVVQVFLGTKQTNRVQENLSRMQENARFAMYFLTQDLRQVGFDGGICGNGRILETAYSNLDLSNGTASHVFQTREVPNHPLYASLSGAISGSNNTELADSTGLNSDRITIRALGGVGRGIALIAPFPSPLAYSDDLFINPAEAGLFSQGDIVLVTDCYNSDIFQISNNPSTGTLKHASGGALLPKNKDNNLRAIYGDGSRIYKLSAAAGLTPITYRIANSIGVPGLEQGILTVPGSMQQLVPSIENMQILYGQRQISGAIFYVPEGTVGLDMEEVTSIRVSLLVRSEDDFITASPQGYFYNGDDVSGASIPDRRLRRIYTSTIAVRNRLN